MRAVNFQHILATTDLSVDEIAAKAGMSARTIFGALQGKEISETTLELLAGVLSEAMGVLVTTEALTGQMVFKEFERTFRDKVFVSMATFDEIRTKFSSLDLSPDDFARRPDLNVAEVYEITESTTPRYVNRISLEKIGEFLQMTIEEVDRDESESFAVPPVIPVQAKSVHFSIDEGFVTTSPTQHFENSGNDYRRLEALQEPLLEMLQLAERALSVGNIPFGSLLDSVRKYQAELDNTARSVNYMLLYAYGLRISASYHSAKLLVEAGELPDFSLDALASVESLVNLHGPFILASKDGREMVVDAERYKRSPPDEKEFQASLLRLGEILSENSDIIEEKTAVFINEITTADENTHEFERNYLFKKGAVKNLVIVLTAGAVVASSSLIPVVGPVVAASLGLVSLEAMKKSKPVTALADPLRKGIDSLSSFDLERLKKIPPKQLAKIRKFVIENSNLLRVVGGASQEMKWFRDVLTWIKQAEKNDSDASES